MTRAREAPARRPCPRARRGGLARSWGWKLALVACALAGCAPSSPGPGIDVERALAHAAALTAIGPRPGDSEAARRAAAYVEHELGGLPVDRLPVGAVELPEITVLGTTYRSAHRVETTDPDLLVHLGPPGRALLVMAHYDTVPGSPGAVDNAAAVGVLLELAHALALDPPPQPVLLAFTANEERGLVGAEALAERRGEEVGFAIALDLIGAHGRLSLNGASALIGAAELHWLADAADRAGVVLDAPLAHRVVSRWWPQAERSDHGAFTRRGIRAVHFYNRGQDGEWIDRAYHSPRDTLDRVDRHALDEIGRLLRALVAVPPPPHAGDGMWLPLVANTVVPRGLVIVVELALALVAIVGLLGSRDGLVAIVARARSARRAPDRPRGAGLVAGGLCFALAAGLAIGVERVFAHGHPAPWLHAPLRATIAEALVLAGGFGLATRVVGRFVPWIGGQRYLALAVIAPLVIGLALLAGGAAELAWLWLVPAALLSLAPSLGPVAPLAVAAGLLPAGALLAPDRLREAAWNGFLPLSVPLAAWIAVLVGPVVAALGWWHSRRGQRSPLGTLILAVGCGLAVAVGSGLVATAPHPCSPAEFGHFHLACERGPDMPWLLHG